tara:strand:+ start:2962 stop:3642 length:681 start_codon:yes stop_codon:yes gene_type:complete
MNNDVVLVVVAHSDDETIGMGGTIRRHSEKGDEVLIMSMTNGVGSRNFSNQYEIDKRLKASFKASEILGFKWIERYDYPDNEMDTCSTLEIIKHIEKVKNKHKPSLVYFHSESDLNVDHRILSSAVLTAFRPQPGEFCRELRVFEVPSATDYGHESITGRFLPNLFIDISETWGHKLSALKAYSNEIRDYPHSRSLEAIKNLAKIRGNQNGLVMAEAFQIIRKIEY